MATAPVVTTGDLVAAADWNALSLGWAAQITRTSDFSTSSATAVDLGSVSVTFTAASSRRYKLSAHIPSATHDASGRWQVQITDGSNNAVQTMESGFNGTSQAGGGSLFVTVTPSAGSVTYKLRCRVLDTGTVTFKAASTNPIVLLAEDIGAA